LALYKLPVRSSSLVVARCQRRRKRRSADEIRLGKEEAGEGSADEIRLGKEEAGEGSADEIRPAKESKLAYQDKFGAEQGNKEEARRRTKVRRTMPTTKETKVCG